MQSDTVYTKTAKGVLETRNKHTRLPRDIGLVFVSIDGKTTVSELEAKSSVSPAKLHEALEKLAAEGFIKAVGAAAAGAAKGPTDDLDFTSPEALASLNAEAATRSLAEADAHGRARDERRAALDAKLRQESEARARMLAEMRAQAESEAREKAEAAADAAQQERSQAERDVESAADAETRAEAEARLRTAAAAVARAQAEARVRAEAEERARMLAQQKQSAEQQAREEADLRTAAEDAALAQAAAEAKARVALEAQIKNIQSGGTNAASAPPQPSATKPAATSDLPTVNIDLPQAPALIDPFEQQQQAERLRAAQEADRREQQVSNLELEDNPGPVDSRAAELQARVQSEFRAREDAQQAKVQGDRALGTHVEPPEKLPDVDFDLGRSQQAEPLRPPPAFSAGNDKPSPGLMRAVAQAAAIVQAETAPAPAAAPRKEEPGIPVDEAIDVERTAQDLMAEQEARARERAQATDRSRTMGRERRQEEETRRAEIFEKIRRRKRLVRSTAVGALIVIVVLGAFLQFVPLSPLIPGAEKEISARLKEPVSIGAMRYPLIPRPALVLEQVVIARGRITADELSVPGLPFGNVYDRVEGRGVTIDPQILGSLPLWATTPNPPGIRLRRLQLTNVKLSPVAIDPGPFTADVEFAANGTVATAVLRNDKGALTLTPLQEQMRFSLSAHDWQFPLGPPLKFTYLDLNGSADRAQITVSSVQARIAGGTVTGTMLAKLGSPIAVEGTFGTENVRLQEVMPVFTTLLPVGGLLKTSGRYALQSDRIETLFDAPQVDATFSITRGEFKSIDLVRTVQASTGRTFRGGRTPFDDLSGAVRVAGGRYSYRQLSLTSGALSASGGAEVGSNGELSGHMSAEVGSKGRVVARSTMTLSGTLKDPGLRQ